MQNRNATAELFLDVDADDVVERGVGAEAERECTLGVEGARPSRHHGGDHLIGLAADELYRLVAADPAQRLDLFGDGRYTLSDGSYEFKYTEKGWDLYKKSVKPPMPSNTPTSSLPRNVAPRSVASTSIGISPTNDGQSSTNEIVPPVPVPTTVSPR